jgi:hypothetical protein
VPFHYYQVSRWLKLGKESMSAAPMALPHQCDSDPALPGWADV